MSSEASDMVVNCLPVAFDLELRPEASVYALLLLHPEPVAEVALDVHRHGHQGHGHERDGEHAGYVFPAGHLFSASTRFISLRLCILETSSGRLSFSLASFSTM